MIKHETALNAFLKECLNTVDLELDRILPSADTAPRRLHSAIRHSVFAGGKRFRPALTFAVGRAFGAGYQSLASVAAAIEMIHTYSLIHDDLPSMDDDDLRRGKPACHIEFGEATAILAGDALQTLAFRVISSEEKLNSDIRIRLISELASASGTPNGMVAGQQMDLEGEDAAVSLSSLEEIHRSKTGALIVASARMGAIIGNASKENLDSIGEFAAKLGLLFQITDDLLDVTQTTSTLGKTAGKDADVDKATYPALLGIEETRRMAAEIYEDACRHLGSLDEPGLLKNIAGFVLSRQT